MHRRFLCRVTALMLSFVLLFPLNAIAQNTGGSIKKNNFSDNFENGDGNLDDIVSEGACFDLEYCSDEEEFEKENNSQEIIEEMTEDFVELIPEREASSELSGEFCSVGSVVINETNFPDVKFREYISEEFDLNCDGELSQMECESVQTIDIDGSYMDIKSLVGTGVFPNLTTLDCSWIDNVEEVDVSKNVNLEHLDCDGNKLCELDISQNINLTYLSCGNNCLVSLDVSKNQELKNLYCAANRLEVLDVSNNVKLESLNCGKNMLSILDVSNNIKLDELMCYDNLLRELNIDNVCYVDYIDCSGNLLTDLDLSSIKGTIVELNCSSNCLTTLELYTECVRFICDNNFRYVNVTENSFDLSGLSSSFDISKTSNWVGGSVNGTTLVFDEGVDMVSYNYECRGEKEGYFATFYLVRNSSRSVPVKKNYFPDTVFLREVKAYDLNKDDFLSEEELKAVVAMEITTRGIKSIKGINYFFALESLSISSIEELTVLDLTNCKSLIELEYRARNYIVNDLILDGCTSLKKLDCWTKIDNLDVSDCRELVSIKLGDSFFCDELDLSDLTKLESLILWCNCSSLPNKINISGCISLTHLEISDGNAEEDEGLETIDLSGCTSLVEADLGYLNGVKYLDFSGCIALKSFEVARCEFESIDLSDCISFESYNGTFGTVKNLNLSNCIALKEFRENADDTLETVNFSDCTALKKIQVQGENLKNVNLNGCRNLVSLSCYKTEITDLDLSDCIMLEEVYLNYYFADGKNGKISNLDLSNCKNLRYLDCSTNLIEQLDVSECSSLETLLCYNNQLRILDVTNNSKLKKLDCSDNKIESLFISSSSLLESLKCKNNIMKELNIRDCIALKNLDVSGEYDSIGSLEKIDASGCSALESLNCAYNELIELNIAGCNSLKEIDCYKNKITSLDISDCRQLEEIYCHTNKLKSLDVSKCKELTKLACMENELTFLDLSNNTKLEFLNCSSNNLSFVDVSSSVAFTNLVCERNVRPIAVGGNKYDLRGLPEGFDVKKTSKWDGGKVDGNILTIDKGRTHVYYSYDCGNGFNNSFSLEIIREEGITIDEVSFPDDVFRKYVLDNIDINHSEVLSVSEIESVTSIDIDNLGVNDLTGIHYFTQLEILHCENNRLVDGNFGVNPQLKEIYSGNNKMYSLDVSGNMLLEVLCCEKNKLESLDLSANTELRVLNCEKNALTSLDLSSNAKLEEVHFGGNEYAVELSDGVFDLSSLKGNFDVTKASDWSGGTVSGTYLTFNQDSDTVICRYACGNEHFITSTFVLKANGFEVRFENPLEVYTYDGNAIKPTVVVTNNGEKLTEGVDYTIKYSNNKNASSFNSKKKPTITVRGKGNLTGSKTLTFEIKPRNLSTVVVGETTIVKGSKFKPVLMCDGYRLTSKDYVLEEPKKIFMENGTMKIAGKGNFEGTINVNVTVVEKEELKKFIVTMGKEKLVFDGTEKKRSFTVVDSKDKSKLLKEGIDYKVIYPANIINEGIVKFCIIGIGNYTGTLTKSYKIAPYKASAEEITFEGLQTDGYEYSPTGVTVFEDLVVKVNGVTLVEGIDYKLIHTKNKKVGNAICKVEFQGNYKGSKNVNAYYLIKAKALTDDTEGLKIVCTDVIYSGKAGTYVSKPYIAINSVSLKTSDYTVSYYSDKECTKVINSKNKFMLPEGVKEGEIYVKIVGKGNYAGSEKYATAHYSVMRKDDVVNLSKAKITILDENGNKLSKAIYTGEEIKLEVKVEVKVGKKYIVVNPAYYEVIYVNNVNKGKATVIINGTKENYVGNKTAKFSIVAANIKDAMEFVKSLFCVG